MATLVYFNTFKENLAEGVHNLGSDQLRIYLSNTAPDVDADDVKADLAEISTGGGYTAPFNVTVSSSAESSGTYDCVCTDLLPAFTATGTVNDFRYFVLYNDDAASDALIGYWDYGSVVSMVVDDELNVDFGTFTIRIT